MIEQNIFKKSYLKTLIKVFEFGMVGGFGAILNTLVLYALSSMAGVNYLIASAIATELAIISNFIGNNFLTFRNNAKDKNTLKKFLSFQTISLITLFGTVFILWVLVSSFGKELLLLWNLFAIIIMFIANFVMNSMITWKKDPRKRQRNTKILVLGITFIVGIFVGSVHAFADTDNETDIPIANPVDGNIIDTNTTNTTQTNNTNTNTTDTNTSDTNTTNTTETNTTNTNSTDSTNTTQTNTTNTTNTTQTNTTDTNNTQTNTTETNTTDTNNTNTTQTNESMNSFNGSIISVSQLGYHPLSVKQVMVYTDQTQGSYNIRDSATDDIITSYSLYTAKNYDGNNVNCQGNMPCLKGDFSDFTSEGEYYIEIDGIESSRFIIDENIFQDNIGILFEFFNAQMQQNSDYHADFHSGLDIPFNVMSDGSFIMEADQAALSLIRLGSAYNRNPEMFQFDNHDVISSSKADPLEYILSYVNFLYGLQGVNVEEHDTPNSVRLGTGMKIDNAFVPGPTTLESIDVYIPGSPPSLLENVEVTSLCGKDDGSSQWLQCIDDAAEVYKCQIDEPCLNISYNDRKGTIESDPAQYGYGVSKGWGYEFGCYFDADLENGNFNDGPNPCMVFYEQSDREYTSMVLLAYLEAWPAVDDYSQEEGMKLFERSVQTYDFIKQNYASFNEGDPDAGFFGAALFLLYDYTGNVSYLEEAHSLKDSVDTQLLSDHVRGNEFYFEKYIRHKEDILDNGLPYLVGGIDPKEFYRGKIYYDYKDAGPTSISNNGERVFQFDNNIQFQNSRYILIEGLQAVKTYELHDSPEEFIREVGHNQLSFLTGMNLIQQGSGLHASVKPMSFILGIGDYPSEFHSRWLVDTGYTDITNGRVIGARGTGYQFYDSDNDEYVYFDGAATILGKEFGAFGNEWNGESPVQKFDMSTSFSNGKTYIPGWINGPFPNQYDGDAIFNYDDTVDTYEYTESTNEIVATAVELFAYLDADMNSKESIVKNASHYGSIDSNSTNTTDTNTTNTTDTNTTNTNSTDTTNNTDQELVIVSSGTDLEHPSNSSEYKLREDRNGTFSIELNKDHQITWYVDGIEKKTTNSTNSTFVFSPGILWVPKAPDYLLTYRTVISAEVGNSTIEWIVDVDDVINPFFSSEDYSEDVSGSKDTRITVITRNRYLNLTDVTVTLTNGGNAINHSLSLRSSNDNTTEWTKHITGLSGGNHYITEIFLSNNESGFTHTYALESSRAHYTEQETPSDNTRRSSRGSGGGSRNDDTFEPEIIYSYFEKDVINIGDSQTLYLDAKNFGIRIESIEALLIDPEGQELSIAMNVTSGDQYYGTWSDEFTTSKKGEYSLESFLLVSEEDENVSIAAQDIKFYSAQEDVDLTKELELIYFVINESTVKNDSEVHLKLDAADPNGITEVIAIVENGMNESFQVNLKLTEGKSNYGTWEGSFIASSPDTTYKVTEIILKSSNDSKTYGFTDRSVYSEALPNNGSFGSGEGGNLLTGNAIANLLTKERIIKSLKEPFVPTILGFAILIVIVRGSLLLKKRF